MRRFAAGDRSIVQGFPVAAFDLSGGPPYNDAAGNLPRLERRSALFEQPWFETSGPAIALVRRLVESNAFTLRLLCQSDTVDQRGPARIVSNSLNPAVRNFTIAQQGDAMVVRLRTPITGINGVRPEVSVPRVFADPGPHDILVTYDGSTLLATAAKLGHVSRFELTPGFVMGATAVSPGATVRPDLLPIWKIIYVALLFIAPAVLLAASGHTVTRRTAFCALWISLFAVLLESTLAWTSGRMFDWRNVVLTLVVGVLMVSAMMTAQCPYRRTSTSQS